MGLPGDTTCVRRPKGRSMDGRIAKTISLILVWICLVRNKVVYFIYLIYFLFCKVGIIPPMVVIRVYVYTILYVSLKLNLIM